MLSKRFRDPLNRVFLPIGRGLAAVGFSANAVTVAGFLIVAAGCYLLAGGRLFSAALVIAGGALLDSFDGAVAKVKGTASARGAFLDSTLDRLSDGLLFLALAWNFASYPVAGLREDSEIRFVILGDQVQVSDPSSEIGVSLALGCLVLAFMTSYIRARAESLGYDGAAGFVERAERWIIVVAGIFFQSFTPWPVLTWALAILLAGSFLTVVQRFRHVWRQGASPSPP